MRNWLLLVLILAAAAPARAEQRVPVLFVTDPPGATVVYKGMKDEPLGKSGDAANPIYMLKPSGYKQMTFTYLLDDYEPKQVMTDSVELFKAPPDDKGLVHFKQDKEAAADVLLPKNPFKVWARKNPAVVVLGFLLLAGG